MSDHQETNGTSAGRAGSATEQGEFPRGFGEDRLL
jgi:hypothetical protein